MTVESAEARAFYEKVGKFTHADAGQMHMYLNYARDWTRRAVNPFMTNARNHPVAYGDI